MKILGGTVFRSWTNAAVARHFLNGLEDRLEKTVKQSNELISMLNDLDEIEVHQVADGTNVAFLSSDKINMETFAGEMNEKHGIWMNYPDSGKIQVHLNESILLRSNEQFLEAFKSAIQSAK